MKMIKKGFTLVELLVVIGVLAVLMAGVVTLIDPLDKNRAAQDATVISDVGQMASAVQTFAAASPTGLYPAAAADLVTNGDLTVLPTDPTNTNYTYQVNVGRTAVSICGPLQSKKYATTTIWAWRSATGIAAAVAACPAP